MCVCVTDIQFVTPNKFKLYASRVQSLKRENLEQVCVLVSGLIKSHSETL